MKYFIYKTIYLNLKIIFLYIKSNYIFKYSYSIKINIIYLLHFYLFIFMQYYFII